MGRRSEEAMNEPAQRSRNELFEDWVRKTFKGAQVGRVGVQRLREAFLAGCTVSETASPGEPFAWYRIPPTGVVTVAGTEPPNDGHIWSPLYRAPITKPEDRLTKPARIGNTIFGAGVSVHSVAARAVREYEYNPPPAANRSQT